MEPTLRWMFHLIVFQALVVRRPVTAGSDEVDYNNDDSYRLKRKLMANYEKDMLPRCSDAPLPVQVGIDLVIKSILNVDEPSQVVTAFFWLRLYWNDCRLRWNASEYGDIEKLMVSTTHLWIPDITLYDGTSDEYWLKGIEHYHPAFDSGGNVHLFIPVITTFSCKLDVTYFPFDRQHCSLLLQSWSYHGYEVDVVNKSMSGDMSVFADNGEWDLVSVPVERHVVNYTCCVEPYPDVTFYLVLQRQYTFYLLNLVLPCMLITLIGMFVFYLPPESGEKMGLGITVLLSLVVFLLMVSESMPSTSDTVPLIQEYFASTILLVSLSCILTIFVLNINSAGAAGKPAPKWLYCFLVGKVAKVMCLDLKEREEELLLRKFDDIKVQSVSDALKTDPSSIENKTNHQGVSMNGINGTIEALLAEQNIIMKEFLSHLRDTQHDNKVEDEWRKIALVLDRLFMVLYFCLCVIICSTIFLQDSYMWSETETEYDYQKIRHGA